MLLAGALLSVVMCSLAQDVVPSVIRDHMTHGIDPMSIAYEDSMRAAAGELPLYGRLLPLELDMLRDAVSARSVEHVVRRARVGSPGAMALELFYRDLKLAEGASFAVYSEEGQLVLGPYTYADTKGAEVFSTPLVMGSACIVELRTAKEDLVSNFRIEQVGHAYRDVQDGACHVDVNCSPEGDAWSEAASGVVRISVVVPGGVGWCSGTLVNNVRQDCRPYILSAWHCGAGSNSANFALYKFYFGYQRANCGSGQAPATQFVTGAQLRAYSNDNGGNSGSDFMLLEANSAIPPSFGPYWAGWDATVTSTSSADGVCIHHPTGAPKRISSYTQTLTTGHWAASTGLQSHWRVSWAATQNGHGVVESGSSGAPLFKLGAAGAPLVIGTLSGSINQLSCSNPTSTSFFGKMSYHWTGNNNTSSQKLNHWLDPDGTGLLVLPGSAMPCASGVGMEEPRQARLAIYPNPATDHLMVEHGSDVMDATLLILDPIGRVVHRATLRAQQRTVIGTSGWMPGAYLVRLLIAGGTARTARFILAP